MKLFTQRLQCANTNTTLGEPGTSISEQTMTLFGSQQSEVEPTVFSQASTTVDGPIDLSIDGGAGGSETIKEGSTLSEKHDLTQEVEPDMMTILLDIRERVHKIELKGEEMITKPT